MGRTLLGVTDWIYFVPYQADFKRALADLREQVFAEGAYSMRRTSYILIEGEYQLRARNEPPETITELREWNGEQGTHSIIDIVGVAPQPGPYKATPITEAELLAVFDTRHVTRAMIEQQRWALANLCRRNEARILVVCNAGKPGELCFVGCSGE